MRLLIKGLAVAAMLTVAPAWAHGDDGRYSGRHWKHWEKHHRVPPWGARYYVDRGYYVREYWRPVPVYPEPYYYPAPAPGVHIIMPDIYIPLRR